jgi:hypothetical protein
MKTEAELEEIADHFMEHFLKRNPTFEIGTSLTLSMDSLHAAIRESFILGMRANQLADPIKFIRERGYGTKSNPKATGDT